MPKKAPPNQWSLQASILPLSSRFIFIIMHQEWMRSIQFEDMQSPSLSPYKRDNLRDLVQIPDDGYSPTTNPGCELTTPQRDRLGSLDAGLQTGSWHRSIASMANLCSQTPHNTAEGSQLWPTQVLICCQLKIGSILQMQWTAFEQPAWGQRWLRCAWCGPHVDLTEPPSCTHSALFSIPRASREESTQHKRSEAARPIAMDCNAQDVYCLDSSIIWNSSLTYIPGSGEFTVYESWISPHSLLTRTWI